MKEYWRVVWAVAGKDFLLERRSLETLVATFAFSLLVVALFTFAFDIRGGEEARFFPGALWIALIFSGTVGMARSARIEEVDGRGTGLSLLPVDRSAIFFGKFLFNLGLIGAVEIVTVPMFAAAFRLDGIASPGLFIGGLVLGTWGFVALGTLFAGAVGGERGSGLLLPVLLFPLLAPVALGGAAVVGAGVSGQADPAVRTWIHLLLVFSVVFTTLPALLYEYILEV